jgi:lipoprotein-releasing system permease protein
VNLPFELQIALRYIRSKRKGPVSLITLITVAGVCLGVTALTVVTSVWNGFEAEFLSKLLGVNAHAIVLKNLDVFRDYEEISEKLLKDPNIAHVNPFVYSEVIVRSAKGTAGVAIKGVVARYAKETPLKQYVSKEAFARLDASVTSTSSLPGLLVGRDLKETLHVETGSRITVISPYGGQDGQPRSKDFEVAGIFHSGMYEFDARMVFVPLSAAQDFFRLYNTVTGLEVWTHDSATSFTSVRDAIRSAVPEDPYAYEVRDWSHTNKSTFGAVQQQKQMITIVLGFIILVAAFNIVATLILLILEKAAKSRCSSPWVLPIAPS